MKESIDLIDEIRKIQPSSRVLFTTYKYNQFFFEKYVFSHFRGKSLPLVFVDYHEYQNALRESGKSMLAGTRYLIDSVLVPNGTFHPKVVVSCSDKEIRLIVSSANLTPPGFSKNAELCSIESIPFDKRHDYPVLYDICDFLSDLQRNIESKPHRQELEGLVEKIDVGSQSKNALATPPHLLHNLKEPILDQVRRIIQEDVTKITVACPFFSQELPLYEKVSSDFTDTIEFIVQPGGNNLPVDVLEKWKNLSKLRFSSIAFRDNRYLHGKSILFHTDSGIFALTGSTNFTASALMLSTGNGGNIEIALIKQESEKYLEHLFDRDILELKTITLKEANPIAPIPTTLVASDFHILEANVVSDKLIISTDYKTRGNLLKAKVHVDKLEKDLLVETNSSTISITLSPESIQALATSSIVSIIFDDNGRQMSSDLRLIHNPMYFPEQFSALNTIIEEDERTWLFKILSRYASLPSFNYVLPLIERLEEYGLFDLKPTDREELLWKLQARMINIRPYSATEQIVQLIDRFRQRHEKRMKNAMESTGIDRLQTIINSFVMINKLIIWLVRRKLQDVDYLRFVRSNVEELFARRHVNPDDPKQVQIITENRLLAYIVMLSHTVDHYQRESPKFLGVTTARNYVKDAFEVTFVSTIQLLRKSGEGRLKEDLEFLKNEFLDVAPEIDFAATSVLRRLNEMIRNLNTYPYGRYSFATFET